MKKLLIVMMFLLLISVSGCGFKDIDKRFLVVAIGVDKGEVKKYNITLKLIIPTPLVSPGQSKYQLIHYEGDSISEAIEYLRSDIDKKLDLGHAKITVIGKALAQDNISKHFDWFVRRRGIQRIEYVAIGQPNAQAILALSQQSERLAGNSLILSFGHEGTESSFIVTEYLYDFYERLLEKGKDPFMPVIRLRGNTYEINQAALFDKEKIKLILDPKETRMFKALLMNEGQFEVRVKEDPLEYTLSVLHLRYKYKIVTPAKGSPYLQLNMKVKGVAEESDSIQFNESWRDIERAAEQSLERSIMQLLQKMSDHHLDPLGFGLKYMATRHDGMKEWEDWQSIYPNLEFRVNVKVTLEGTGEIK
ncbi:Ger(x)C family spore germination protein [Paenibacillus aquistagni]|uniref:Ger(x)C family spore germination protein n=1 Tax=Paenibacillus aquistagni TaxID=1852522 RepID=UPI00145A48B4|nr:Ger(x)C family spore germination protein [Paenibacillus aquistagni]NMM50949.1 Ger(x)C family spore germination protein [Paenibacillus aquistagni]